MRAGSDASALAKPTSLTLNWSNQIHGNATHGSAQGGLFTPVCPPGYVAMGSVAIYHEVVPAASVPTVADFPALRCVKAAYTREGAAPSNLTLVWDDDGSGCDFSGTVWSQPPMVLDGHAVTLPFLAGPKDVAHGAPPSPAAVLATASAAVSRVPSTSCVVPAAVHIAIGASAAAMNVQWSTYAASGAGFPVVQWGVSADALIHSAAAQTYNFTADPGRVWWNHVATMSPLAPGKVYYYRVGNLNAAALAAQAALRAALAPCVARVDVAACVARRRRLVQGDAAAEAASAAGAADTQVDDEARADADTQVDGADKDEGGDLRVNSIRRSRAAARRATRAAQRARDANFSTVFHFRSQVTYQDIARAPGRYLPQRNLVFGDMGAGCAFTLCPACTCDAVCDAATCAANRSSGLVTEVGRSTHILHTGDFAYNMDSDNGLLDDQFFANIEQVAAYIPYMVNIGNHENSALALAHYTERFRLMPTGASGRVTTINGAAPNNWFFSWDDGLVHWVTINSELYFEAAQQAQQSIAAQWNWLRADLVAANANRANVPWIAVQAHRSMYCSCDADCDGAATLLRDGVNGTHWGLEDLLFDQGVDFFLNGHEHNYERNWPTYRNRTDESNVEPKAPIYIVTGAAGCSELHEPFTRPQPPRSAFRSNNFGYSRMIVHNHTHVRWQQVIMDPGGKDGAHFFGGVRPGASASASPAPFPMGSVIDDTWIVQSAHGPFDRAAAPRATPTACGVRSCRQYDHWGARLAERGVALGAHGELIAAFRREFGEAQWLDVELGVLGAFRAEQGSNAGPSGVTWEDTSADGSSDGSAARHGAWQGTYAGHGP